jgi:hypothetical protein
MNVCDETGGKCAIQAASCAAASSITDTILSAGLSTATIVGIVVAAVCLGGGAAGGSVYVAVHNASAGDPSAGVTNNPLYDSPKMTKDNPLFENKPAKVDPNA